MDPSLLTVYSSPFPKIRLGKDYDGGYIIAIIPEIKYSILISGGIANDISFEEAIIDRYKIKCIAFDGTINKLPKDNINIEFIKKNIDADNNLHDLIDSNDSIFIKMDIEGAEIPWIKSLSDEQINKFAQIVMEFHYPFSENEIDVFNKINKNHVLVHFHGNNCCGTRIHKGISIPKVFECTYIHKKYFTSTPELNRTPIPGIFDMKNLINKNDIYINYPPFVKSSMMVSSRRRG
jgi:hypothetical protein